MYSCLVGASYICGVANFFICGWCGSAIAYAFCTIFNDNGIEISLNSSGVIYNGQND